MAQRIGIIGGTFDPIHYGHLFIAEEARFRYQLERVIFVPAAVPPHKPGEPITDAERRYDMTVAATRDNTAFQVSRIEIERPGPSYSVDTVAAFREECGRDAELFFIMGADSVGELTTWYQPERLVEMCSIIAAVRPGFDLEDARRELPAEIARHIIFMDAPGLHISSTELRERAANGMPVRYLVPDSVEQYIWEHSLYRNGDQCAPGDR